MEARPNVMSKETGFDRLKKAGYHGTPRREQPAGRLTGTRSLHPPRAGADTLWTHRTYQISADLDSLLRRTFRRIFNCIRIQPNKGLWSFGIHTCVHRVCLQAPPK